MTAGGTAGNGGQRRRSVSAPTAGAPENVRHEEALSGRLAECRSRCWEAADAARRAGDVDGLARAAIALGGIWVHEHRSAIDQARVEALQREARAALDPGSVLARRLDVRLAAEHAYLDGNPSAIGAELDRARAHGDPVLVAEALSLTHHCLLGPHHAAERMDLADELIRVSVHTGRALDAQMGLAWRTVDLLLAGDRRAGRSRLELADSLADHPCAGLRYLVDAIDVMLAVRDGRFAEAEELATAAYALGLEVGDADALGWYGAQLISLRWLQGRPDELLPVVRDIADSVTVAEPAAGFVAGVAALAAAAGDRATATAALACLRAEGLDRVASSSSWSVTMLGVCEAAHLLGDVEAAGEAYALLAPFADLPVMASLGVAGFGSAHRPLGLAARTFGDLDLAVAHLERAVLAELAVDDRPWHAVALAALADALDERDDAGDRTRAVELRAEAVAAARNLGLGRRADEWSRHGDPAARCRRDGPCWSVELGGRAVAVPHCVGLTYLAELIANPDVEIDALALASGHAMNGAGELGDPVLDRRAVTAYRRRIGALHQEIDDAELAGDSTRAGRARRELDQLVDHLASASGLHRGRRFADDAERARVSVHKALKRAIRVIGAADRMLGDALAARVSTGVRCVYRTGSGPVGPAKTSVWRSGTNPALR